LYAYSPAILQTTKECLKCSLTFKFAVFQQLDTGRKEGEAEGLTDRLLSVYNTAELMVTEIYKKIQLKCDVRQTVILN
jgi:hypothetical protein